MKYWEPCFRNCRTSQRLIIVGSLLSKLRRRYPANEQTPCLRREVRQSAVVPQLHLLVFARSDYVSRLHSNVAHYEPAPDMITSILFVWLCSAKPKGSICSLVK